ncbi:MAG: hypothetical protein K1X85_09065 [Ignavibacteria bacterium]|nr:hypothetical protein [Ignavibacteria bacterium]
MKRAALFFLISLLPHFVSAQNFNWITPNKTYLKIYIADDGMYRLKKSDFTSAGVTTAFDPRTLKLYNMGIQLPVYFQGEQDGVFNDNDFIDFFGKRNYGGETISRNSTNGVAYTTDEYYNPYSDTNVYWIDWGGANGIRIKDYNYPVSGQFEPQYAPELIHFESDQIYSLGENTGSSDYRYLTTEKFTGEGWYWTLLYSGQSVNRIFDLPQLFAGTGANASLRVFAYPQNKNVAIENEHSLELIVNGVAVDTLYSNDFQRFDTTVSFPSALLTGTQNNITVRYKSAQGFGGAVYFDLFELGYPKAFRFSDNRYSASLGLSDTTARNFRISGFSSGNPVFIYDVVNNLRITGNTVSADTLKFSGRQNARLEIVNDTLRRSPVRIKSKQVPDLVSSGNGADYLIVYNRLFESQAEQLRAYRQTSDGFRTFKAEIEDIYDIFGYGMEGPLALRYFVKHVYENWQQPRVGYLTLFGRGSLDPKKNKSNSAFHQNLVPVYGNPPSDGYFVNFNMGTFFYYNQVAVGRIPAYYTAEAQTMVDKIIAYEGERHGDWNKTFTFITGGGTPYEQYYHQQKSNFEAFVYVEPTPLSSFPAKVYRSDTSGTVTFNYADSIRKTIDRGTLFVNFRGHAGSHDWEVGMSDPDVLQNGNKLPIVLSLTCFTGESSYGDFRGFGEKFVYLLGKGAIGFVGTTGWSFGDIGNTYGTYILQSIKRDSVRRLGDLTRIAGKSMSGDSTSFSTTHTVNCYGLLGDPAAKLRMPKTPEFEIKESDFMLASETVLPGERQTLTITPKNFGLYADTCVIRFELRTSGSLVLSKDTVYRGFKYRDTIIYSFPVDSSDIYTMTVTLDKTNRFNEEDETNNSATITIPVKTTVFQALGPVNNSLVYGDSVELSGLNPNLPPGYSLRVFAELDTTMNFNSPLKQTFVNNSPTGHSTKFKTVLQSKVNGTLYHWRTSSIVNGDSSGWSSAQTFIYSGPLSAGITKVQSEEDRFINAQIDASIAKTRKIQFPQKDLFNTVSTDNGIMLAEKPAGLYVRSYGSNGEEASYFSVADNNVYIDGGENAGLNALKVKRLTGEVQQFLNLRFTSAQSSDSLLNYLNTFDSTHYLMLLNAAYFPGGTYLSSAVRARLRQFGSTKCDSIGLISYFHTWSFIGYPGAPQSEVSEMFDPCCRPAPNCVSCDHWTESISQKSVTVRKQSGTVQNIVGPASSWTDFSWEQSLPPNTSIIFDVIGLRPDGTDSLLMQGLSNNKFNQLSQINAAEFPRLNLVANLIIDIASNSSSPVLKGLFVNFAPAAELLIERSSLVIGNQDKKDNLTSFSFRFSNAGYVFINETAVEVFRNVISDTSRILADTVKRILKMDSSLTYAGNFTDNSGSAVTKYIFRVMPGNSAGEFYLFNNTAEYSSGTIAGSQFQNSYALLIDGKEIKGGEIVEAAPEARLVRKGAAVTEDTDGLTSLKIFVNGKEANLSDALQRIGDDGRGIFSNSNPGSGDIASFTPKLKEGNNRISILLTSGTETDSLVYEVTASGSDEEFELQNYPNPMRERTSFMFSIGSEFDNLQAEIRIYTTSGRTIRKIPFTVQPGMNVIEWDGRDDDGDNVANGTYLYRLVSRESENRFAETRKLVVLR